MDRVVRKALLRKDIYAKVSLMKRRQLSEVLGKSEYKGQRGE